jgi:hypothetical protein
MKQSEKLISTIIECAEQLKEMGVKMEKYVPKKGDFCSWTWEKDNGSGAENYCIFGNFPNCLYLTAVSVKGAVIAGDDDFNEKIDFSYNDIIRPLTKSEKQIVIDKLHEQGKDWDAEKMEIIDYQWRAEKGGLYWYYDAGFEELDYSTELFDNVDLKRYNCGNYFKTEAEAEAYRQYCLAYKNKVLNN